MADYELDGLDIGQVKSERWSKNSNIVTFTLPGEDEQSAQTFKFEGPTTTLLVTGTKTEATAALLTTFVNNLKGKIAAAKGSLTYESVIHGSVTGFLGEMSIDHVVDESILSVNYSFKIIEGDASNSYVFS